MLKSILKPFAVFSKIENNLSVMLTGSLLGNASLKHEKDLQ